MKKLILIIISMFTVILISCIFYSYPRDYYRNLDGIKYRLGTNESTDIEEITIIFNGKISRNILFGDKFEGQIIIGDIEINPNKNVLNGIKLNLDQGSSKLIYMYYSYKKNRTEFDDIGEIYFDDSFDRLAITLLEPDDSRATNSNWNGKTGLMITAPAKNKDEALEISNELMKEKLFYNGEYHWLE